MGLGTVLNSREYRQMATSTSINIPEDADIILLTGTAALATINVNKDDWGRRIITLIQYGSGTTTITTNADTTTPGQVDVGGSNLALAQADSVTLYVRPDGALMQIGSANI